MVRWSILNYLFGEQLLGVAYLLYFPYSLKLIAILLLSGVLEAFFQDFVLKTQNILAAQENNHVLLKPLAMLVRVEKPDAEAVGAESEFSVLLLHFLDNIIFIVESIIEVNSENLLLIPVQGSVAEDHNKIE